MLKLKKIGNRIFYFALILLLILPLTSAGDSNEYVSEFNNEGETCSLIDIFYYDELRPTFWNANHLTGTTPAIYLCCKTGECVGIIFDIYHQNFLYDSSVQEIIDLNYIKYSLQTGELSQYEFISKGIDVCRPFGKKKLNEQTISLVAKTTESIALMQETKKAKQVADTVKLARSVNLISPLNLAEFGVSVACNIQNKKLETALETLSECNLYLENIANAKARSGYVMDLNYCLTKAREELYIYLNSDGAKIKHGLDKTVNVVGGFFTFLSDITNKPNEAHEFTIEETEYEIAQKVYSEIKDKEVFLHNPNKDKIFGKYVNRILQKRKDYDSLKISVDIKIENLTQITLSSTKQFFTNLFYEPNYNLGEGRTYFDISKFKLKECNKLFEKYKYNSAIECLNEVNNYQGYADPIINREASIQRVFDWRAFLIFVAIIIIILFILYYLKNKYK